MRFFLPELPGVLLRPLLPNVSMARQGGFLLSFSSSERIAWSRRTHKSATALTVLLVRVDLSLLHVLLQPLRNFL